MMSSDPVPAVTEADATGSTAAVFADIRETLNVDVVNLVWRHLATMPGALEWTWARLKPLYQGPAAGLAAYVRGQLELPALPAITRDVLSAAGVDAEALASIRNILDSYRHTNALALVCFSALLARFGGDATAVAGTTYPADEGEPVRRADLPRLIPVSEMKPAVARLVNELNRFGEDEDPDLLASMYRHLAHWPPYLALLRTALLPLHESGELVRVVARTRLLGERLGRDLAREIPVDAPPFELAPVLAAVRRFARHPIARMTGICSLIGSATPA